MRLIKDDDGQVTHWQAETPVEQAAISHVNTHVPIFAACSLYGIHAFIAGAEWALEDKENGGAKQ